MKYNLNLKIILKLALILIIPAVWASCMPKVSDDTVVVSFALPNSTLARAANQISPFAICDVDTSFVGAYNSNTGEASIANVRTTTDPALFAGISSGQSVLTYSSNPELELTAGAGWNFYYFGAFGLTNCSAGNTIVSFGQKLAQNLQSDLTVDLDIVTAANHLQQNSAALPVGFADIKFKWRSLGATACSSDGTVQLSLPRAQNRSITTAAGIPYSITGTNASIDLTIGPLPKNLTYKAVVKQTSPSSTDYTFEFSTTAGDAQTLVEIDVPSSASGLCQVSSGSGPTAPTGLAANATSSSNINLTWTDNATNETGYRIERSLNNSTWSTIHTTAANANSYSDSSLSAGTLYYYRLAAFNGGGDSAFATANATTQVLTAPSAPSGLNVVPLSSTSLRLTWTDNSANEASFDIQRSTDNVTYNDLASTNTNIATYDDTGLTASTIYYYRVRATNAAGSSAYSASDDGTTNSGGVPTAPTTLVVMDNLGSASLMWSDNSSDETGFEVERSTDGVSFSPLSTTAANTSVYMDGTTMPGNTYHYRVRAANGGVFSAYTNTFMISF